MRAVAQEDNENSVDAAIAIQPHLPAQRRAVYEALLAAPLMLSEEIADAVGIKEGSARARLRELEITGLAKADGVRRGRSGRNMTQYRAVRPGEPPGTRRSPGVESRAPHLAVANPHRPAHPTRTNDPDVGRLWVEVWDTKPTWMPMRQHRKMVEEALEQHPGDTGAGLRQALRDLEALGGGR